jgi:hypothetical protein
MRSILIVGNETLAGPTLAQAISERLADGPATFHVVVPATPVGHALTWDEGEANGVAAERLETMLATLRARGAEASGEVGVRDPVAAAQDALRDRVVDEVILSTLPSGPSRWLRMDAPNRLRSAIDVPLTVVTAAQTDAEVGEPAAP